jgi:hypothetical protein
MRHLIVVVCLAVLAVPLAAATFELPTDAQLRDRADVVVVATVLGASAHKGSDDMLYTDYQLRVEEVLKGQAGADVVVSELGGFLNGRGSVVAGAPRYETGARVVAFLRQREDGTYYTANMALGKYRFAGKTLVRDTQSIETLSGTPDDTRDAETFIAAVRGGDFARAAKVATNAPKVGTHVDPPQNYVFNDGVPVRPIRWEGCETSCFIPFIASGTQISTVADQDAIEAALGAWSTSSMQLAYGGKVFTNEVGDDPQNENGITFNYSGPDPGYCDGAIGCGIVYFGEIHTFKGMTWYSIEDADVVIYAGTFSPTALETLVGHEVGHALAFIDTPVGNALMSGNVSFSRGAALGQWDIEALSMVYSTALPPCNSVSGVSVSGGGAISSGQSAELAATASGTTPFSYQWYEGPSGNTANPIGGATSSTYTTPPITTTKQYWVKVSNSCPSSAASATVTITPQVCDGPVITNHPASQTVAPNAAVTLQAAGNGSLPFSWQWYRGSPGNWTAVGTNSPTYNTGALTQTTSYYVRMSNNCGSADSNVATITVNNPNQCVPPVITAQPGALNVPLGQGSTIAVTATGTAPVTYQWYRGASLDETQPIAGATANSFAAGPFTSAGTYRFWVRASNACGAANSQTITITVNCPVVVVPEISVPALGHYSTPYNVYWTGDPSTATFELQEASDAAFTLSVKTMLVVDALQRQIPAHSEVNTETRFFYRVRALSKCTGQPTAWSATASTVIQPPSFATSTQFAISLPFGTTTTVVQNLLVPGFGETATNGDTFSIAIDVPWLTVFPASGALSAGGTTVQLTINPATLEVGSTTGTITITRTPGTSAKTATHNGPVTSSSPFSVSMVTPVSPDPRDSNPPPGTLIIPAVAHAQGVGSEFRSDVRLVNVSFDDMEYEITFTPSGLDGTAVGKKTRLTVSAGDTVAFDDIVKSWYGAGTAGEGGLGTIEIRPITPASANSTFASSRTYALAGGGTLGQFIPALRIDQFVRDINQDSLGRISLQQVANSPFYRTQLGFVEGSGVPATFRARLFDGSGNVLRTIDNRTLPAFGQFQQNLTALFGDISLTDGRVEVEVTSAGGIVSAYASVLNNITNDPLMVFPVQPARFTAGRYVLSGIAEFVAPDGRNFHSDMRIYNGGNTPVTATLWYYDRGQSEPGEAPRQVTIAPGEVKSYNDVLPALWPTRVGGGSIVITAPPDSSLVATAQTYSRQLDGGTKGQFIPGVTFRDAAGLGERALEVLQLEQSAQYRSNVGVVEVTGAPAVIEIMMFEPDSKLSAVTQYGLKANEYLQFDRILESLGKLGTVYNGRVSIRVIGGTGRVYAYGSTVDNRTEDPTYVPAQ